jgi:hypothetical protein
MTLTPPARPRDWFDELWETHAHELPIFLRGSKETARKLVPIFLESMSKAATAPESLRALAAVARISRILQGARGLVDTPEPSPEQIADAVERMVERLKPR